jgi:hypothetical protein
MIRATAVPRPGPTGIEAVIDGIRRGKNPEAGRQGKNHEISSPIFDISWFID